MSLAAIVTALRPVIDNVTGIAACFPRIPETKPTESIFAVIESPSGEIGQAGADLDRITYRVNVYVLTKRAGALWAEQDTVLPFVDSIPAALRSNFTLGGITYGTDYDEPAWELTAATIDDQEYIGVVFHLLYKQKATVTFSG
jgi:hypothetical protein